MTDNSQRIELIKQRLTETLNPTHLIITDDSHRHMGHAGAKTGRGHFILEISAPSLHDKSAIEQHRMIYAALGDLMETDIHALTIRVC